MLAVLVLYLFVLSTNLYMPGCSFLFLFALLSKLVISNVALHSICQFVKLVQLFDWILHEMEEPTKVSQLGNDLKPQVMGVTDAIFAPNSSV
jgi:hypothetical protein